MRWNVLYVGNYQLPDKNAAAQRVISIAKGISTMGHNVTFLNYTDSVVATERKQYYGFTCYELPERSLYKKLTNIDDVIRLVDERKITHIFTYNYPACALARLIHYCKKKGIRCYADVTEWYVAQGNLLFRIVKTIDTEWRMRYLHKKMDGIIAISEYLYQYYRKSVKTVKIPPTVDIAEEKWHQGIKRNDNITRFVYAGRPSPQKERLDLIVDAVKKISKTRQVHLTVIGITEEQYEKMYGKHCEESVVAFCGRTGHLEAVRYVSEADWSIVIRDDNKVVKAGFPTKVVESIACGTPVIANRFSNVDEYLDEDNSILCELDQFENAIIRACDTQKTVERSLFHFSAYLNELEELLRKNGKKKCVD